MTTPSRDLSTILLRRGRFSVILDPRNLLAGLRLDHGAVVVHVTVIGLRWQWRKDGPGQRGQTPDNAERAAGWLPGKWA